MTVPIPLFAIANNMLANWREYQIKDFGDFENISLPKYSALTIDKLLEDAGLKPK